MKKEDPQKFDYYCQDVQELLLLYVVWPEELTFDERRETPRHLVKCPECRYRYEKLKQAAPAIHANPKLLREFGLSISDREVTSFRKPTHEEIMQIRFEARLERAGLRRKRREQRERAARIKTAVRSVSAVAACIIAVFGLYLSLSHLTGSKNTAAPAIADKSPDSSVKIELITNSVLEILPAGQPITAPCGLKTLRINDNRQMVLNAGTQLSIMPHNLGCLVKLDKGEIYTEVEHDGKPFIVETIHGRAVITGTAFNIRTDDRQMELVVTEGTVRFESDKSFTNVTAGHKSCLALNTEPALPVECDTAKLTAWLRGQNSTHKVAAADYQPEIDLSSVFDSQEIDLERIDYHTWIKQKRYWFKREFPHIFRFKEALTKDGIEADYPELLIKSGDLRGFAYPEKTRTRFVPANYESMIRLASAYNKDAKWLNENLNISRANLTSENETSALKSFDRWLGALEESLDSTSEISSELLTCSLHASVYLSETRTLKWLGVTNNMIVLNAIEKSQQLELLEQQIKTSSDCIIHFQQMFAENYSSSICDDEKKRYSLKSVIDNIEEIKEIEKKVSEYEAFSK